MHDIKKETHAEAHVSSNYILPRTNTDVQHLEELKIAAKEYVDKGLPIVPMGYNHDAQNYKFPLIRWEKDGPLRSVEDIDRAFDQLKGKIFGIATIVDGYTMVDFDTKDTPDLFKGIEPTAIIETGKGYHYWYKADENIVQNGPIDLSEYEKRDCKKYQLEIYTKKRLDIIPPSKHHSGAEYEWTIPFEKLDRLAEFPDILAKLCKGKQENVNSYLTDVVTKGGRNNRLIKVSLYFARKFSGDREKIDEYTHEWNLKYCVPPMEVDRVNKIGEWAADVYKELDTSKKQSKGRELQSILEGDGSCTLFKDQDGIGYARISVGNKKSNVVIYSTEFKEYLRYKLYKETGKTISSQQLEENLGLLNAKAVYEGDTHSLYHRVAAVNGAFYYDLLNDEGEIVQTDENDWKIISGDVMPFLFKAGCGKEQVRPERGGDLKDLLRFINIKDKDEQMLFISTLPVRLIRDIDQAIVYIYGPAGSSKTTTIKITKDLVDPSTGGISMPIKNVKDVIPLLSQSWVFANDNISKINDELSNFLCVVVTGAENSSRTLYTNSGVTVLKVKNPAYITGINIEAYKSDLLSRILLFKTTAIPKGERCEVIDKFEEYKPLLLGALFDTLSKAMKVKKNLTNKTEFRMVDFALWGAACAEVLGYGAENFEAALQKAVQSRAHDAIYSSSAGRALLELLEEEGSFEGTMTELLRKLKNTDSDFEWNEIVANNPSSLGKKFRELENSLAEVGVFMDFGRRSGAERTVTIKKDVLRDGSDG